MEEKKKRGRPKKLKTETEIIQGLQAKAGLPMTPVDPAEIELYKSVVYQPIEPLTEEKAKTQLTGTTEHPAYDPFKNPFFKAKMGLTDKKG